MKIRVGVVLALLLLSLTGCSGTPESAGEERTAPQASDSPAAVETETPAEPELTEIEHEWVDNETWETLGLEKNHLLESAQLACDEFAAGKTAEEVSLPQVPVEITPFFANTAREWFCPA